MYYFTNMKKSILVTSFLLLVSSLVFSACTAKDQLKTEIINKVVEVQNKVNDKIDQKVTEEKPDLTDEQLLNQLNTDDSSVDTDLNALETDLQ